MWPWSQLAKLRAQLEQQDEQWLNLWTQHQAAMAVVDEARKLVLALDRILKDSGNTLLVTLPGSEPQPFDPTADIKRALDALDAALRASTGMRLPTR